MKEKKNLILDQHSALTTFKLSEGNYFSTGVEKSIFSLLFRSQQDMKNSFRETLKEKLSRVIAEVDIDKLINCIYTGRDFEIAIEDIKPSQLKELAEEMVSYRKDEVFRRTGDEGERNKLLSGLNKTFLAKFSQLSENHKALENKSRNEAVSDNNETIKFLTGKDAEKTSENIKSVLSELKDYCKDLTVKEHMDIKNIDLTALSNSIDTNMTYLKKDLKKAVGTKLEFNYINKKKIDVDVVSALVASVSFQTDKSRKTTWLSYQIPVEILKLLLIPEIYVPLSGIAIQNIKGIYSFRMYGMLKDHIKRGEIELSKEELFTFFMLPKSYEKKTHFINKFLAPTLKEVELNSGIHTEYTFIPERNWEKIIFKFKKTGEVKVPELKIKTAEDVANELHRSEDKIDAAIIKMRKNIYVSKAWNKNAENKIYKLVREESAEFAIEVMNQVYAGLKQEIETTLVQYMNGVVKKLLKEKDAEEKPAKVRKKKNSEPDETEVPKKEIRNSEIKFHENESGILVSEADRQKLEEKNAITDLIYNMYLEMKDEKKAEILEKAKELFMKDAEKKKMTKNDEMIFKSIQKSLVVRVLKDEGTLAGR